MVECMGGDGVEAMTGGIATGEWRIEESVLKLEN